MIEPFSGPAVSPARALSSRACSVSPSRWPATVNARGVPKFDSTSAPTWWPPGTWREAEPIPPFSPNDDMPRPAPTAPCAKSAVAAAQAAR